MLENKRELFLDIESLLRQSENQDHPNESASWPSQVSAPHTLVQGPEKEAYATMINLTLNIAKPGDNQ